MTCFLSLAGDELKNEDNDRIGDDNGIELTGQREQNTNVCLKSRLALDTVFSSEIHTQINRNKQFTDSEKREQFKRTDKKKI